MEQAAAVVAALPVAIRGAAQTNAETISHVAVLVLPPGWSISGLRLLTRGSPSCGVSSRFLLAWPIAVPASVVNCTAEYGDLI